MKFVLLTVFVGICHCAYSTPVLTTELNLPSDDRGVLHVNGPSVPEQHIALTGQKNFQAAQQIFYFFDKHELPENVRLPVKNFTLPNGYLFTPKIGAHKLHLTPKSWNDARNVCIEEGGHLAVIRSAEEEMLLQKLRMDNKLTHLWLGLHDLFVEGEWVSVLDQPLNKIGYVNWASSNPDNDKLNRDCGLLHEGGMDDGLCVSLHPFICKINIH